MSSDVIARFIDDRDSLSSEELDVLIAGLQSDPDLAGRLHALLSVDDLLGRVLTADRADFESQVYQRLVDLQQEDKPVETDFETAVLNQVSRQAPRRSFRLYPLLALAASVLMIVGVGIWSSTRGPELTGNEVTLRVVSGSVILKDMNGNAVSALTREMLRQGCWLDTAKGGRASLAMDGGATVVQIRGVSSVKCRVSEEGEKALFLKKGSLAATVAKQKAGKPMVVGTDYGSATVLGTRLAMSTTQVYSRMDVTEGTVEWRTGKGKAPMLVKVDEHVVSDKRGHATVFGKPIVDESFSGDLANWHARGETVKNENYELSPKDIGRVRGIEVVKDGKKVNVLELDSLDLPGWINMALKQRIVSRQFVVSFEYKALAVRPGATLDSVCLRTPSVEMETLFKGGPNMTANRWSPARGEYALTTNTAGQTVIQHKNYWVGNSLGFQGRRVGNDPGEGLWLRMSSSNIKVQFANIRIIPVINSTVDPESKESMVADASALLPATK